MMSTFLWIYKFSTWYRRICLTLRHRVVSKIINIIFVVYTLHSYSQSDYHLINLIDIDRFCLIYFQACNSLKILYNGNPLNHFIFNCRILCLVFLHNAQYLIWKYLGYYLATSLVLFQEVICKLFPQCLHNVQTFSIA